VHGLVRSTGLLLCPRLCRAGAFSAVLPRPSHLGPPQLRSTHLTSSCGCARIRPGLPAALGFTASSLGQDKGQRFLPSRASADAPLFTDSERTGRGAHTASVEGRQVAMWATQHRPGQLGLSGDAGWDLWGRGSTGVSTASCHIPTVTLHAMTSQYGLIATSLILCL